jgi:hypothetical protein
VPQSRIDRMLSSTLMYSLQTVLYRLCTVKKPRERNGTSIPTQQRYYTPNAFPSARRHGFSL